MAVIFPPPPVAIPTLPASAPAEYGEMLLGLSPAGWIWGRGGRWEDLLIALAQEYYRIHARFLAADAETDPRTATETLAAWERMLGITNIAGTDAERRLVAYARMIATGGASKTYFTAVALGMGIPITITAPMSLGWHPARPLGYPLYSYYARFDWLVTGPVGTSADLKAALVALFEQIKPAHTRVGFAWV